MQGRCRGGTRPALGNHLIVISVVKGRVLRRLLKWGSIVLLLVIVIGGAALAVRLNSFSQAVSGKGLMTSELGRRAGNQDRFNLLIMGYGGKGHDGAYLTDSMLVYSIPLNGGDATQLSIPRDLWVQSPAGSGRYMKINAAFATAYARTGSERKAADSASRTVSQALGVPINGWMLVDFAGFRDLVNALGGVDVDVQRSFSAKYPANDDPSKNYHWIHIHFKKGVQHMNGEEAIRYARARYSTNPLEGSDFARAARQQRLVSAIKAKLLSPAGWVRVPAVINAVQPHVKTDLSASDLMRIFRHRADDQHQYVLSNQNVLVDAQSSDGQYILVPRNGNWALVRSYVRSALDGSLTAQR